MGSNPTPPTILLRPSDEKLRWGYAEIDHIGSRMASTKPHHSFKLKGEVEHPIHMNKQLHVYYSGMVQGVGFRFTAEDIANDLGLTGWVKNLADGRVELVAEGPESKINEFLDKIKKRMGSFVRGVDIQWLEATGESKNFEIDLY